MKTDRQVKPLARKEDLIIQSLPDEVLVYDRERDRAHCLNQTAAFVWEKCDGRNSTDKIARDFASRFNCAVDENVIWLALDQLDRNHLLARRPHSAEHLSISSRRSMIKTLGLTAAVAIPLVSSILAPTVHAAASCAPSGAACDVINGPQCCPGAGSCIQGTCQVGA